MQTRTPVRITERVSKLCRELDDSQKPGYVRVQPDPDSQVQECFTNVRDKVERDGGRICFGWAIWEWPRVMIEAEFHAIWISPEDEQIDITPKPEGIRRILFLPDSARAYDYNRGHYRIDNIRRPLTDDPLVLELIAVREQLFAIEQEHSTGRRIELEGLDLERYEGLEQKQLLITARLVSQFQPPPHYGKPGRNDPCPCGSGRKFKKCCGKQ